MLMSSRFDVRSSFFVVPWHPYPLHSGGALRAFHLIRQLGRFVPTQVFFPVDAQYDEDEIAQAFCFDDVDVKINRIHVPSSARSFRQRVRDRWDTVLASKRMDEPANSVSLALLRSVKTAIRSLRPKLVVLTEIETLLCAPMIRRLSPGTVIVADMHNVNHVLQQHYDRNASADSKRSGIYKSLRTKESSLADTVDHVFACSEVDLREFERLNSTNFRGSVIPNGVDTHENHFDDDPQKFRRNEVIYCASLTTPANIDGLLWFHREIWPIVRQRLSSAILSIVGSGSENPLFAVTKEDPTVHFRGRVPRLAPHYRGAGVSICPLRIGSGTRLKILEAMSFGNPIVSTSLGCEGLGATDAEHLLIRDEPQQFANAILELLSSPSDFHQLRTNARAFVTKHYDWDVIGDKMKTVLNGLICGQQSFSSSGLRG